MIDQAEDFRAESRALHALVAPLDDDGLARVTQFKAWTFDDVVGHLHVWNQAALLALTDEQGFLGLLGRAQALMATGGLRTFEAEVLEGLAGRALVAAWETGFEQTADAYAAADPKQRIRWAGPSMSARSSITARHMETWAHGQEVYDALGLERPEDDRIRNIVQLGVNTFGWTFANRGLPVPDCVPRLSLTSPSGQVWAWHAENEDELIEGSAVDFCRVVTQTRNIADTGLVMTGDTAGRWMTYAQCFAGPPEDPPAPGTRHPIQQ
ncbi:MAG: TIGR03084 family metal-binding protein [Pseudomonadota bacterium]